LLTSRVLSKPSKKADDILLCKCSISEHAELCLPIRANNNFESYSDTHFAKADLMLYEKNCQLFTVRDGQDSGILR
jgi:hypothetical protein